MRSHILIFALILNLTSCATLSGKKRVALGAASGAAVGATGGALLSPNDASRGMNALVFGLTGALVGGVIALLSDPGPGEPATDLSLKAREAARFEVKREYLVEPSAGMPSFVKQRLQPTIIEETIERDQVSEEGVLHEPHKTYRIKRQAELFPNIAAKNTLGTQTQEKSK